MKEKILQFLGGLLDAEPDVSATIENSGKSVWVTLSVPGWDDDLEIEFRDLNSLGLYLPSKSADDDVPFRRPDEHFTDFEEFAARVLQLLHQARVA